MFGSRQSSMFGSARPTRGARLRKTLRTVLVLAVVLGVVGGLSSLWLWQQARSSIQREPIAAIADHGSVPAVEGRTNLLVVGRPTPLDESSVDTTDVLLVQFDDRRPGPVVVSFPAALKVEVAGSGDRRLDQVHAMGGAELLARVVEDYTGLQLDRYVEVSVDGLGDLVERLGGVEVCDAAGGCAELSAMQVRERLTSPNDDGHLAHVTDQFHVLSAVADGASGATKLWNPLRFRSVISGVGAAVRLDDGSGVRDLLGMVDRLARAPRTTTVDVRVVPGFLSPQTGYVHAYPEETAALMQALQQGGELPEQLGREAPQDLAPQDVRVLVLNGEGSEGLAGVVADRLTGEGFVVVGTENHETFDVERTIIQTTEEDEPRARLLAELLPNAVVEVVPRLSFTNTHVVLIVGADRAGVPDDGDADPDGAATTDGDDA